MSSEQDIIRFTVSARSATIMKGIIIISLIIGLLCVAMFFVVRNEEPAYEELSFSVADDEIKMVEIEVSNGETIYYKLESDIGLSVRLMTEEEYNDMIGGHVYSYIEDDWDDVLEKRTEPLDADTYVLFVKGDTYQATGTLYYGVMVDRSDKATIWIGMFPVSILVGMLIYLIYGAIADIMHSKSKRS
ncbi:MAG: hypothetical protein INQ03_00965 [Candidatus Heimdallarchaeota archaeon]|nr:hypothetical protein [Candidatus Heimdallarchaeota archaeon]